MEVQYSSSWRSVSEQPFSAPLQAAPPDFPTSVSASASATFQGNESFPFAWPESYGNVGVQESTEERAASSSRSHSQAEKRRRDRINTQLGILRKLIPDSDKMDKAALLGSAIEQVKELKRKAKEVAERNMTIPSEVDEVSVDVCGVCPGAGVLIRASVSCDDRPEVMSELIRVVRGQRLEIVRADITSVGGRIKNILLLSNNGGVGGSQGTVCLTAIKRSLNVVLSRIASASVPTNYRVRSKRQRFFQAAD